MTDSLDTPVPRSRWDALMTRISWTHFVWNWWTGCDKTSPGCALCYAESWAKRSGRDVWGPSAPRPRTKTWGRVEIYRRMARDPAWREHVGLREGERARVFVGSLMDWAEARDDEQRRLVAEAWPIIRDAGDELDFLMLTKRPQNIPELLPPDWGTSGYRNVWLMTSIESGLTKQRDKLLQGPVLERAVHLLRVPAVAHAVSYEPALAPLAAELTPYLHHRRFVGRCPRCMRGTPEPDAVLCVWCLMEGETKTFRQTLPGISWVIYGAESGARHRPEGEPGDPKAWARQMRDLCRAAGVAYFHKQSADRFNERGVELDGEILHEYPVPRAA